MINRKIIYWLFLTYILQQSNYVYSQPIITNSTYPVEGTSMEMIDFEEFKTSEDYRKNGANQVWNFSDLQGKFSIGTLGYLSPNETPYGYLYPNATIAMTTDKINYSYFIFKEDGYQILGKCGIDTLTDKFINKPTKYYKWNLFNFPMTFKQHNKDSFLDNFIYQEALEILIKEERNIFGDGFGTLIIKKDTFLNVLRVKEITKSKTTIKAIHPKAKDGYELIESTRFFWWSNEIKAPILCLTEGEFQNEKGEKKPHKDLTYTKSIKNYLTNKEIFPLELTVNVTTDRKVIILFTLTKLSEANMTLLNSSGKVISTIKSEKSMIGKQKFEYDGSHFLSGLYFIRVETNYGVETIKIYFGN